MKKLILIVIVILFRDFAFCDDTFGKEYLHYKNSIVNIFSLETQKDLLIFGGFSLPIAFFIDDAVKAFSQEEGFYGRDISRIGDLYGHRLGYFAVVSGMVISDIAMRTSPEHSLASLRLIAEGVFGGQLVVEQLKMITGRERPNGADFKSFPSGHAAGSFGLATCLNAIYGKKVGLPAYAMAVFVATSRIQDNKHYLSDVIAGGLIGTMVARGFSGEYRSNWRLDPQISTRGIGMTLSINF